MAIYILSSLHESGIKLSEEERAGLNRMKELVETGEYDCVFAWEISRIARRKKILFSILEYLTERKIQLIIKEPHRQVSKYSYLCRDET
ncbi:MAG: recombinase family protein [Bacteroidaceae bacterium]|nr:recombinase family protein [Bacteroidaceae bacterium]